MLKLARWFFRELGPIPKSRYPDSPITLFSKGNISLKVALLLAIAGIAGLVLYIQKAEALRGLV